jgi:hypothetical protein
VRQLGELVDQVRVSATTALSPRVASHAHVRVCVSVLGNAMPTIAT